MSIVLIESDWNLKLSKIFRFKTHIGINRIRVEFKAFFTTREPVTDGCINRIRLEFKGQKTDRKNQNRKRINRIRFEFKAFKVVTSEDQW